MICSKRLQSDRPHNLLTYLALVRRAISADLQCVSSVFVSRVAPQGGGGSLVVERPTAGHVPGALWPVRHQKIHSPVVLQKGAIK